MSTRMAANKLFAVAVSIIAPTCLKITSEDYAQLWHHRYGHLSFKGLKILV